MFVWSLLTSLRPIRHVVRTVFNQLLERVSVLFRFLLELWVCLPLVRLALRQELQISICMRNS